MAYKIFIDGAAGTTGLRISERLTSQPDIELLTLSAQERKSLTSRVQAINSADVSVLCLPDAAAAEVAAAASPNAKICDAGTTHRTKPGWVYGFAELPGKRAAIAAANRVSVPGCHATGFVALAAPLVAAGALSVSAQLCCHSITGYSGGGKPMIEAYETSAPVEYASPRQYALGFGHKHLSEMRAAASLTLPPLFSPIVANYYGGMLVSLPLPVSLLAAKFQTPQAVAEVYAAAYKNEPLITVHQAGQAPPDGTLAANALSGKDTLEIFVLGNGQQLLLAARFDNLGKGASGAAVQCLNLMLGRPETAGLVM
jgi:N-acetyl-gamma-glutamyl-phosphate reductase